MRNNLSVSFSPPRRRKTDHGEIGSQLIMGLILLIFLLSSTPCRAKCRTAQAIPLPPQPVVSKQLQNVLNQMAATNLEKQPGLKPDQVHLAVIDLANPEKPRLAQYNGNETVYPSSVIKMVYMGYTYHLAKNGELEITASGTQETLPDDTPVQQHGHGLDCRFVERHLRRRMPISGSLQGLCP
jgi:hypothetical protein